MMDIWLPLIGGLLAMIAGGDLLVRGAVQVAERLGVSPLVIGLTLVGFGTSMPELVASVQAALAGSPGIAYGNIVGSNIANVLLIVGASALLFPIAVASAALRRDAVVMLAVAAVFAGLAVVTPMSRPIGAAFLAGLVVYIALAIRQERRAGDHGAAFDKAAALEATDPATAPGRRAAGGLALPLLLALGGLVLVILGGTFLVRGAVTLAQSFAIPETVIGLTVVAIGTSMPELVTSLVAAVKRQSDVAFGNVVGSNIYNILGIGGTTALLAPSPVPEAIRSFDTLLMLGVSVLLVIFAATGLRIVRWEGLVLLAGYGAYVFAIWP
ncbi:calcium/sodium antiporter [Psychromarinibacter sp. C21-152]|uniref:Calcium/sodium antiporter n=1 Tax=Psychromarinibacter sediminicola TaxID=3033385 RepID=A0AAE3T880_9RHOB|nr:calcium/sodium antiporter [Psychromarinibacter sediminicola]MDF0599185.1 calcium/sodium antiporter [Psychromarinibacter sediminicola]